MNYEELSESLKSTLKLKGSPVALGLVTAEDEIPSGMPAIDKKIRHCMMVNLARYEGKIFYATVDKHECNGGCFALGFKDLTPSLKSGEFYYKLGKFSSVASSKRTMLSVPHLPTGDTFATLYAPLERAPFTPQVIIIIANPWTMLKFAQSSLFRLGGRVRAEFSGIQSVCSDVVAQTFLTGKPNFSLGCDGSRRFSGIAENEMIMGFPAEMLPEMVDSVTIVAEAPGSSK